MTIFRWMPRTLAVVGLSVGIAGCGGGDNSPAGATANATLNDATSTAAAEGLWIGTMRAGDSGQLHGVVILALPSGETRLVADNCLQVIAFTQNTDQTISGSGNAYAPDGSLASCPVRFSFANGSALTTASITGQVVAQQRLTGTLSADGSVSTFTTMYNAAYRRSGELSRLAGTYVNGAATIQIDANGNVSGSLGGYFVSGTASVISPTKNAWYLQIQQYTVGSANGASGTATPPVNGSKWGGAATLIDSPTRTDGELVVSLGNADSGFGGTLIRQ